MTIKNKIIILTFLSAYLWGCGGIKKQTQVGVSSSNKAIKNIPSICRDLNRNFKPVTHILSRGSYNSKASSYSPIVNSKGFIAEDINNDKVIDYIFIERTKKHIQMVSCVSDKKKLNRKVTPFKIHETIEPDFQTISEFIQFSGEVLILTIDKHEHNWGSDREINSYTYSNLHKDFILEAQERTSSSGDGLRSDTFEFYDLKNRRYEIINTCGRLEEGCKSFNKSGKIIPAQKPSTLLKPSKIYSKLKAD
jgi:hypothetical protein